MSRTLYEQAKELKRLSLQWNASSPFAQLS
jgi:hypothetical protein